MTFGFPRRRPSLKGLAILAAVVVVLFVLVGLLGKAGSSSGGGSSSGAAPTGGAPGTGIGPTRGPEGAQAAGEWTFDEGAGRAVSDTAGGAPLSLQGAAEWDTAGQDGPAVRFDGRTGYAETSQGVLDPTKDYTVTVWVRLDRVPDGFATAVSQDAGSDSAFSLGYVPSGAWAMSAGTARAVSTDPPVRGRWTQLAGVHQGAQVTLYVDGSRQATVPDPSQPGGSGPLAVARGLSNGRKAAFFPGAVDGLRVYDGALTDDEITKSYQSGG